MAPFRRSLIRLLVTTLFLLFVAWVCLKLMQYKGDPERLLSDFQHTLARWNRTFGPTLEKIRRFFQPFMDKISRMARDMVRSFTSSSRH